MQSKLEPKDFKVGESITVIDGSFAICIISGQYHKVLDTTHRFEVRGFSNCNSVYSKFSHVPVHDIIICDMYSGLMFLHSATLCTKRAEEMTLAEICRELGRDVKIIK